MTRTEDTTLARRTRTERLRVYRELEEGTRNIVDLLEEPPGAVEGADLWDVLLHVPNLGRSGIRTICERTQTWPHLKLCDLTIPDRDVIIRALPYRVER